MSSDRSTTAPRKLNRRASPLALAVAALTGSAVTVVMLTAGDARTGSFTFDTFRNLDLFGEVFEQVHENYVVEPEDKKMIEGAIDGMLSSLDPHSSYLSEDDFKTMQEQTRGSFAGLGIQVTMDNEGPGKGLVRIVSPIDETPAARAGLMPNDLIYEIDGEPVYGLTLNEAIVKMKGKRGTKVTIGIIREDEDKPFDVALVRDIVTVSPVISRVERDDYGYVRLTGFTEQSNSKMRDAIRKIDKEIPGGMKGLILDVRNNPGGLLDQAVTISDAFLHGGEIVSTRGRRAKDSLRELGTPGDMLDGRPIIVLVNGGSASASEIVAGALQDRNRALVLGTKSFGKGSVQTVLPLQNGLNGALRLTTARYYTPAGRSIQAVGIVPDIAVPILKPCEDTTKEAETPGEAEAEVKKCEDEDVEAKRREEADLPGALKAETKKKPKLDEDGNEIPDEISLLTEPIRCEAEKDCQLEKALDIMADNTGFKKFLVDAGEIER